MSELRRGNLLWESSRMVLPEHRERMLERRKNLKRKAKPILDEQRLKELSETVSEAVVRRLKVSVTVYDPFGEFTVTGEIVNIDPQLRRIKLADGGNVSWIPLEDIMDVSIV